MGTVEGSKRLSVKSLSMVANFHKLAWHAWLGAAVTVQQTATSVTQSMAVKGEKIEGTARNKISERFSEAESNSLKLRDKARARVDLLEQKVGKAILGVPTQRDVDKLALLMADMSESINELANLKRQQQQSKAKRPSSSS